MTNIVKNKKRYLVDVDDVLSDFLSSLLKESGSKLTREDIDDWDCFSLMEPEARDLALNKILSDSEFWRNLPLIPHAQTVIEDLRRRGTVLFVTAPWADRTVGWKCDGWGYARAHWLREHFNTSYEDIIIAYSKQYVKGDVFIDNRYKNVINWDRENTLGASYLMREPSNRHKEWRNTVKVEKHGWVWDPVPWE